MKLDPQTCPIGTRGFIPPTTSFEFERDGTFDWFKQPFVVLNSQRQWITINDPDNDGLELLPDVEVFADWESAVRHTLEFEREEAFAMRRDAQELLDQIHKVENWLKEHGN